ncbi:MAG: type IV secretory system conjugative DNA transfer family protein [Steroidobacteraceae bacterium]|jgi:type IV secretion system protein VirD4|nr:type IV secretory system conjugative DNA transfer family protein [Steroidobacteraceae bacterium]
MTLHASTARWRPTARPAWVARAVKGGVAALVLVLAGQYLAGFLFLRSVQADPREATPLTVVRYGYYFGAREDIRQKLWISSGAGLALVLLPVALALRPRARPLHGDAKFSTRRQVRRAGLLAPGGIILARMGRRLLRLSGQQGVAVIARSRSGKGAGIVIPNLLEWPDSVICVDPKRENYTVTAGHRARCGHAVYLFDPFSESRNTARWNPLGYIPEDPALRVNGLQRIADMLYQDAPGVDPFWTASARTLFLGIGLYVFETPSLPRTIGQILRLGMASDDEGFGAHWKRLIEGRNAGRYPLSAECVRALCDVIDLAPVTASSIRKTFTSRLDLWLNPILDWATSANDFDLRELRSKRMSIYVGVLPEDLHRLRPVLSLFFQQAIALQTRQLPEHNPALKHQVMFLLDEFTSLGRIPIIAEAIGLMGGYNIRTVLVIQARSQLREVYGPNAAETILRNLAARVVFGADEYADAREISEELGTITVKTRSVSKPAFDLFGKAQRARSVNVSEQRRPLLLPQEVQAMKGEEAIVFYEGIRPIRCTKIRYFRERRFKRLICAPPTQAASGRTAAPLPAAPGPAPAHVPHADAGMPPPPPPKRQGPRRRPEGARRKRVDQLTLKDFDVDLSQVVLPQKPEGERLTPDELDAAVNSFMLALRER